MKKNADMQKKIPLGSTFNAEELRKRNILGERIASARRESGISASGLSRLLSGYGIDVQRGAVSKWELGVSVPNAYQFLAICSILGISDVLSFFSSEGGLNAIGISKLDAYKNDLIASGLYRLPPKEELPEKHSESQKANSSSVSGIVRMEDLIEEKKSEEKMIPVRFSLMRTSAGTGCFLDDEYFETVMMPESDVPSGTDFAVSVSGNSMEPVFHNGETVFVKCCSSIRPGEVGLFILDGEGYIKMYDERQLPPDDAFSYDDMMLKQPMLVSYNDDYDPIMISPEMQLQVVGKIL